GDLTSSALAAGRGDSGVGPYSVAISSPRPANTIKPATAHISPVKRRFRCRGGGGTTAAGFTGSFRLIWNTPPQAGQTSAATPTTAAAGKTCVHPGFGQRTSLGIVPSDRLGRRVGRVGGQCERGGGADVVDPHRLPAVEHGQQRR